MQLWSALAIDKVEGECQVLAALRVFVNFIGPALP
jgi:hypothetical protein